MTEYTKAKPFEFEGNWVGRRNESGQVVASFRGHTASIFSREGAEFCHAFVEAENNEWHEVGDGFRKGRWTAVECGRDLDTSGWEIYHDDFLLLYANRDSFKPGDCWGERAQGMHAGFLTWHTARYPKQPAEPTGLGAVIEVAGKRWVIDIPGEACPWWRMGKREGWGQLIARGPVTVLSEGVTS